MQFKKIFQTWCTFWIRISEPNFTASKLISIEWLLRQDRRQMLPRLLLPYQVLLFYVMVFFANVAKAFASISGSHWPCDGVDEEKKVGVWWWCWQTVEVLMIKKIKWKKRKWKFCLCGDCRPRIGNLESKSENADNADFRSTSTTYSRLLSTGTYLDFTQILEGVLIAPNPFSIQTRGPRYALFR